MKIDVIGTGSAFSTQCNTSAVRVIDKNQQQWLIDCGPTVPRALWQRNICIDTIDALYFTHIHPDHCTGLTALLNRWDSLGRKKPLDIFAQPAHMACLQQLTQMAHWPKKALRYTLEWHNIEAQFQWRDWQIQTATSQHSISNRSLLIEIDKRRFFYSGDGRPTAETVALMDGAQVVFQECHSADALSSNSSHGDLPDALNLRKRADFGELYLYHCDDAEHEKIRWMIENQSRVSLATDGLQITIPALDTDDKNKQNH